MHTDQVIETLLISGGGGGGGGIPLTKALWTEFISRATVTSKLYADSPKSFMDIGANNIALVLE